MATCDSAGRDTQAEAEADAGISAAVASPGTGPRRGAAASAPAAAGRIPKTIDKEAASAAVNEPIQGGSLRSRPVSPARGAAIRAPQVSGAAPLAPTGSRLTPALGLLAALVALRPPLRSGSRRPSPPSAQRFARAAGRARRPSPGKHPARPSPRFTTPRTRSRINKPSHKEHASRSGGCAAASSAVWALRFLFMLSHGGKGPSLRSGHSAALR